MSKRNTPASDSEPNPQIVKASASEPEYKVRVRFLKRTEACGGVFAGGSTARVRKSTADILVAEKFAVIIGV